MDLALILGPSQEEAIVSEDWFQGVVCKEGGRLFKI